MDNIGYFKGKPISEMTREELLDFAKWAGMRIYELQRMEDKTQDCLSINLNFIKNRSKIEE